MRKILFVLLALFAASSAHAAMVRYELTFAVERVEDGNLGYPDIQSFFVGDVFHGSLLVDDAVLAVDGPSNAGTPLHLRIAMGDTVWAQDFPSDLRGLRGPCYNPALACTQEQFDIWGLGSDFLGFEVLGGVVTGLWGGVFGGGDFPFADFQGTRFGATPYRLLSDGVSLDMEGLTGALTIRRVPSPGTLSLIGLGLLLAVRRRVSV